tara:strand:- start:608 stop:799 length:192 start_codon:yes stop_codon:yes gene_type:complete
VLLLTITGSLRAKVLGSENPNIVGRTLIYLIEMTVFQIKVPLYWKLVIEINKNYLFFPFFFLS